ncbi:hypothetical protein Rsub_10650 [Raphidocelis subcapitata]|uniref:Biotin-protein ligase N-terminal domain-containing protein n=1 Tax=Raphidocelis subcapitata TaxID=307507 RepID=A0A2V0PDQ6_9CHLO|nr:hypothetical protein Rsub_10650 [Raphidocelis subcapitata]|eukprot:GBF97976.1 hypothetical protein Rsub_10650 [Raphidocelis subcapitata]
MQQPRAVAVYRGEGAGWRSVQSTVSSLSRLLPPARFEVGTLCARELLAGGWQARTALLVMPGGADLPYCKHLNGAGNALVRDFVAGGGSYLGLCAGAYYAASRVEFEAGGAMGVVGRRELRFFPGAARGAVVAGFDYQTERGAAAVRLRHVAREELQRWAAAEAGAAACAEGPAPLQQRGQEEQRLVGGFRSESGQAVFDGPGSPRGSSRWQETLDYCNGGPFFVAPDGSPDWECTGDGGGGGGGLAGVQVLARYVGLPPDALSRVAPSGAAAAAAAAAEGGPRAAAAAVAAVRCRVGRGAAVLCGTHPELEARWLDVCGTTARGDPLTPGAVAAIAAGAGAAPLAAAATGAPAGRAAQAGARGGGGTSPVATQSAVGLQTVSFGAPAAADAWAPTAAAAAAAAAACPDAALAHHTAALHAALEAAQPRRDELLRVLLLAALMHQGLSADALDG